MFEQSVIPGSTKGKRVWTTCVGVTGQALLVTAMVVAPMLWPQVMPTATFTLLVPHAPAGRPKGSPAAKKQPANVAAIRKPFRPTGFVQPAAIPARIEIVSDLNRAVAYSTVGDPGVGIDGGIGDGSRTGVLADVLRAGQEVQRVVVHPVEPPKPVTATIPRFVRGGNVREPRLIHRVEPRYPPLAIAAHLQGVVQLGGVIAVDGHIAELSVESGNPLLVPAALEAVRQWRYEPTLLNGEPIEVATSIFVTFILNR
jgi:protein TonB